EVGPYDFGEPDLRPTLGESLPPVGGLVQRRPAGLLRQVGLGGEVTVEASVGQAGLVHDPVYPDTLEPLLAEQPARDLEDALAVLGALLPADSHGHRPR